MTDKSAAPFTGHDLLCRRGERMVFRHVSFALSPGGVLLLRGPNGSGKSSLLRLMAGLLRPAAGELRWDGRRIEAEAEDHRRQLAFLGHLDAIKPALSVAENLGFWCGAGAVELALAALGITSLAPLSARFLSAGQRRRLALARIVASAAPLWLLDEPTNALDDEAAAMFAAALASHRARGGMAAIALHGGQAPPQAEVLTLQPAATDPLDEERLIEA
jgi:heme exporter protein A